jgi:hypothetical protein
MDEGTLIDQWPVQTDIALLFVADRYCCLLFVVVMRAMREGPYTFIVHLYRTV